MHWLLRWSSSAHSCHVLIITRSDITDLIWFELIFSLMIKKNEKKKKTRNFKKRISLLHSSVQFSPDWPIGELQLQLKTSCHVCCWLAPTGSSSFVGGWYAYVETCFERHPTPGIRSLFVLWAVKRFSFQVFTKGLSLWGFLKVTLEMRMISFSLISS